MSDASGVDRGDLDHEFLDRIEEGLDDDEDVDGNRLDETDDDDEDDVNTIPAANAVSVLEYLARAVVDDPDSVEVDVDEHRGGTVALAVHVAPGDMGRVIGKRGRIANAIRTVVRAAAARDGVNVDVDFVD